MTFSKYAQRIRLHRSSFYSETKQRPNFMRINIILISWQLCAYCIYVKSYNTSKVCGFTAVGTDPTFIIHLLCRGRPLQDSMCYYKLPSIWWSQNGHGLIVESKQKYKKSPHRSDHCLIGNNTKGNWNPLTELKTVSKGV